MADAEGNVVATFPPSGTTARLATSAEIVGSLMGCPITRTSFGEITGLPETKPGVVYLVSTLVAQAARRADVVAPDTGPTAVRKDGQVVAVRGFQTFV
jgi:hypothetical protein